VVKLSYLPPLQNLPTLGQHSTNNFAAMCDQIVVGGGFNPLQESKSALGGHTMSKNSFMATECAVGKWCMVEYVRGINEIKLQEKRSGK